MIPELFAPGIVSLPGHFSAGITFSADGSEIFFGRFTLSDPTDTIWVTRQLDGVWSTPVPFAPAAGGSSPFLAPDGARLYFTSPIAVLDSQISFVDRVGDGWSAPTKLTSPFSTRPKVFPTVARSGNLYFSQIDPSYQGRFYMAPWTGGQFDTPAPLPAAINRFITNDFIFVAQDESYLVLGAVPAPDTQRLFVSFKGANGMWGAPIELGMEVNSTNDLIEPSISPDGKYLFFARQSSGSSAIYWVDASVIFDLRPARQGAWVGADCEGSMRVVVAPDGCAAALHEEEHDVTR